MSSRQRQPTAAEIGNEVTIAIVALTAPMAHFVCVSDQMISHDDILPADESALIKNYQITRNWSVAFSATKIENVLPLLDKVGTQIGDREENIAADKLQEFFTTSIAEMIRSDFFNRRLAKYGYRDLEMFRRQGRDELGNHFSELCRELDEAELGAEFIVYGYESGVRDAKIFEVNGKGEVIDRMALRYAVVGSGYWMASASLKRKPSAPIDFDSMVYRVLEAKFSAETASGVGRRTTVTFKRPYQYDFAMQPEQVDKIRAIWESELRKPEPVEARKLVGDIRMAMIRDDELRDAQRRQILGSRS